MATKIQAAWRGQVAVLVLFSATEALERRRRSPSWHPAGAVLRAQRRSEARSETVAELQGVAAAHTTDITRPLRPHAWEVAQPTDVTRSGSSSLFEEAECAG